MKVQAKHGKVTQNMHGASRNYRYVWDVSPGHGGAKRWRRPGRLDGVRGGEHGVGVVDGAGCLLQRRCCRGERGRLELGEPLEWQWGRRLPRWPWRRGGLRECSRAAVEVVTRR